MNQALCLAVLAVATIVAFGQDSRPRGAEFEILAPRAFAPALGAFIDHKRARGTSTELLILEDVLALEEGADDAEKVKRRLFRAWRAGASSVLLVGDADVFPVRYMCLDRVAEPAFNHAFYPSDLYFADVAKADGAFEDWNACRDGHHAGYFGEVHGEKHKAGPINVDGVDYKPELALGRWPAGTTAEVALIAAKSIRAENARAGRAFGRSRTAAFFAVEGWIDTRAHLTNLARSLAPRWTVLERFYGDASNAPDVNGMTRVLRDGAGLVAHTGHGNDDVWEKCLALSTIERAKNATNLPVMISIGCSTARFAAMPPYEDYVDFEGKEQKGSNGGRVFLAPPPPPSCYQRGPFNHTGLGEQLLRQSDDGAVAYIGCNTGAQPCALTLLDGFIAAVAAAERPRLGEAWRQALVSYVERERLFELKPDDGWYPPSIFFQGMKFMLFGDPTFEM